MIQPIPYGSTSIGGLIILQRSDELGRQRRAAAFTLVELLVVMLIITVLAAIVLRLVQNASQQSKVTQCRTQMRAIIMALDAYRQETGNLPPLNNGGYILTDRLYSGPRKYLRPQDLRDPWGHDFVCKGVGATLHQWGALYAPLIRSLGPDGKADTADDLAAGERQ